MTGAATISRNKSVTYIEAFDLDRRYLYRRNLGQYVKMRVARLRDRDGLREKRVLGCWAAVVG